MVTTVGEVDMARALVDRELELHAAARRARSHPVLLGAMIEVPSLLFELDALLPRVDFVSVGSNDLLQYLFAADRNNARVATRYDALSAAPLRALASHRRGGQAPRPAAQPVRRDGGPAARGDGAHRPWLPLHFHGAGLDRAPSNR